jgi:hypothetical protein
MATFNRVRNQDPSVFKNFELEDIYCDNNGILEFLSIYDSLIVSSSAVERLFSYFHRIYATFLKKSLKIATLIHLGRVYVNAVLPAK